MMPIKGISPDYIMLRANKVRFRPFKGGEIWTMTYIEKFARVDRADLQNAKKLLDALFGRLPDVKLRVRILKDGIRLSVRDKREGIYDFLVGEFMTESRIGKKTLTDLFLLLGLEASRIKPSELIPPGGSLPGATGELEGSSESEKEPE